MEKSPTISVIVPIYNAERYLARCVDSILSQTFTDFELLLIDDGSPDGSGKICDEYAKKDLRVHVYHKENGGVSSARNLGLDNAKGKWISFIDADDYISQDFFNIEGRDDADVIQKSYYVVNSDSGVIESKSVPNIVFKCQDDFYRFFVRRRPPALWDKLIRRKLIGNVRFNTDIHIGEDFLFFLSLVPNIKEYVFDRNGHYYYVVHEESAMGKINNDLRARVQIMIENISNISSVLGGDREEILRYGIIYQYYINVLYTYRKILSDKELKIVKRYYQTMSFSKLRYVSNEVKLKLMVKSFLINMHC